MESARYKAALAITGTIRGTSKIKLYQELEFETVKERRWFRRLCCFLENFELLSSPNRHYYTRSYSKIRQSFCSTETFNNSFLPQTIREWNKLEIWICQAPSYSVFLKALLGFIRLTANSTCVTNDAAVLKLLALLRVGFSHLREHEFKHNFQNTLNPFGPCSFEAEDTCNFLCTNKVFLINEMFFLLTSM